MPVLNDNENYFLSSVASRYLIRCFLGSFIVFKNIFSDFLSAYISLSKISVLHLFLFLLSWGFYYTDDGILFPQP